MARSVHPPRCNQYAFEPAKALGDRQQPRQRSQAVSSFRAIKPNFHNTTAPVICQALRGGFRAPQGCHRLPADTLGEQLKCLMSQSRGFAKRIGVAGRRSSETNVGRQMNSENIAQALNAGVLAFSAAAGIAWLRSAMARVPAPTGEPGDFTIMVGDAPGDYSFVVDGVDVIATAALQTKWNRWAAAAACITAACQGLQALPWKALI
jgi:hypothetical protein